jgi:hypothetical protein
VDVAVDEDDVARDGSSSDDDEEEMTEGSGGGGDGGTAIKSRSHCGGLSLLLLSPIVLSLERVVLLSFILFCFRVALPLTNVAHSPKSSKGSSSAAMVEIYTPLGKLLYVYGLESTPFCFMLLLYVVPTLL